MSSPHKHYIFKDLGEEVPSSAETAGTPTADIEEIAAVRDECAAKPKNAPLRVELAEMLRAGGDLEGAADALRQALAIKPSYTKAQKALDELGALIASGARSTAIPAPTAAAAPAPPPPPPTDGAASSGGATGDGPTAAAAAAAAAAASSSAAAPVRAHPFGVELPAEVEAEALAAKARGNQHFKAGELAAAIDAWSVAIKVLDAHHETADARLFSNRAAAQLAREPPRLVAVAMDGQRSADADPSWWKGHWYRGQALLFMLRGKSPSSAMSERAEQSKIAFERCLACPTLPPDKRAEIERFRGYAKYALFGMSQGSACPQQ